MKIKTIVDPTIREESVEFHLRRMTPQVSEIINLLNVTGNRLWCYLGSRLVPVPVSAIYFLHVEGNSVAVYTADRQLAYHDRLYQVRAQLGPDFLEASRSVVFNYRKIDHLELQNNGTIDAILKNRKKIHIARRKIKKLQERLGL